MQKMSQYEVKTVASCITMAHNISISEKRFLQLEQENKQHRMEKMLEQNIRKEYL